MLLGEDGIELLLAIWTIVGYGVLHLVQTAQKVDEFLRIHLAQVCGLDGMAGWIVGTVGAVIPEIAEVCLLVGLGILLGLLDEVDELVP